MARIASTLPLRPPWRQAPLRGPLGAPARAPCIRQRAFPRTAGDLHGLPPRVLTPHLGLRCMGKRLCTGLALVSTTPSPTSSAIALSPLPHPHANIDLGRRPRMRDRHPVLGGAAAPVLGQRLDALAS